MTHVLVGLGGAKSDHSPSVSQTGTEDIGPTGRERGEGERDKYPTTFQAAVLVHMSGLIRRF